LCRPLISQPGYRFLTRRLNINYPISERGKAFLIYSYGGLERDFLRTF